MELTLKTIGVKKYLRVRRIPFKLQKKASHKKKMDSIFYISISMHLACKWIDKKWYQLNGSLEYSTHDITKELYNLFENNWIGSHRRFEVFIYGVYKTLFQSNELLKNPTLSKFKDLERVIIIHLLYLKYRSNLSYFSILLTKQYCSFEHGKLNFFAIYRKRVKKDIASFLKIMVYFYSIVAIINVVFSLKNFWIIYWLKPCGSY